MTAALGTIYLALPEVEDINGGEASAIVPKAAQKLGVIERAKCSWLFSLRSHLQIDSNSTVHKVRSTKMSVG